MAGQGSAGVDFAGTPPSPAQLLSAGREFVVRYVSTPGNPKNITGAEAAADLAAGVDVCTVFETTAARSLDGFAAGAQDAASAASQITGAGGPGDAPIFFAVDFSPTSSQLPAILSYFEGAKSVVGLGRMGVYGDYFTVHNLFNALGLITFGWQSFFASGGQWDNRAQLRQISGLVTIGGTLCDQDLAMADNFGQWNAPGAFAPTTHSGALQAVTLRQRRHVTIRELPHQLGSNMLQGTRRSV